jgi:hypothetical protein
MSIPPQLSFPLDYTSLDFYYMNPDNGFATQQDLANMCFQYTFSGNVAPTCSPGSSDVDYTKCYQYQLCENKKLAELLYERRDTHLGAQQKYDDYQWQFFITWMTTIHLVVAILVAILFIFYSSRKVAK